MIRLRQVALVASDLDVAISEVCQHLAVDVCFHDPGVAEFGLRNALFRIGDQFLEIVSPTTTNTTAGRLLERAGGDCGYMAIYEVDDLDMRIAKLSTLGVRVVWQGDFREIRGRHLHPKDTGGTLVSIDQPERPGDWHWAGPKWHDAQPAANASSITGITIASADPTSLRQRWQQLDIDIASTYSHHEGRDRLTGVALAATHDTSPGTDFWMCGVHFTMT